MIDSKLFTPASIGPLTLRNRTIRSAAFESMCPGNVPSQQLLDYHRSVAAGGVGMTTIAYAAVAQSIKKRIKRLNAIGIITSFTVFPIDQILIPFTLEKLVNFSIVPIKLPLSTSIPKTVNLKL